MPTLKLALAVSLMVGISCDAALAQKPDAAPPFDGQAEPGTSGITELSCPGGTQILLLIERANTPIRVVVDEMAAPGQGTGNRLSARSLPVSDTATTLDFTALVGALDVLVSVEARTAPGSRAADATSSLSGYIGCGQWQARVAGPEPNLFLLRRTAASGSAAARPAPSDANPLAEAGPEGAADAGAGPSGAGAPRAEPGPERSDANPARPRPLRRSLGAGAAPDAGASEANSGPPRPVTAPAEAIPAPAAVMASKELVVCVDGVSDDAKIDACSALIAAGNHSAALLSIAYDKRGTAYSNRSDYERAIADFDAAAKLDPSYPHPVNNRANIHLKMGNLERAIRDYQQAVRMEPNLWQGHYNLGNAYLRRGDNEQAIRELTMALRLHPDTPAALARRGQAYCRIGDDERALRDYDEAARRVGLPGWVVARRRGCAP